MARPRKPPRLARDRETGHWAILYHDGARDRRRRTGTSSREEAEAALREFLIEQGKPESTGLREPHELMVGDILAAYAEERAPGRASAGTLGLYIGYLAEHFGDILVSSISPKVVAGYCAARKAKKIGAEDPAVRARVPAPGDSTLRKEIGVLIAALNHAIKQHRLTRAPHIELPEAGPGKDRWCTPEEIRTLLAATQDAKGTTAKKIAAGVKLRRHLRLFILLALATAGRRASLTGLRWVQVDLPGAMVDLNPPGRTQTAKKRPKLPLDQWMVDELKAAHAEAQTPYVLECRGKAVTSIAKGFRRLAVGAGLPDVTPHVLRHTVGTWAAQGGEPIWKIAGLLGHSSARTTELYAHHHPDFFKDTIGTISGRMGWRETGGKPPSIGGKQRDLAGNRPVSGGKKFS